MLTITAQSAMRACTKGVVSPRSLGSSPLRAVRPIPFSRRAPVTQAIFKGQDKKSKEAPPPKQKPLRLGFTKDNELFVGRAAMLGFAFSLIGEVLTGKGALAQLGYEIFDDKLNIDQIDELVVGLIVFNLIAAILPASGTFVKDEEEEEEESGPIRDPKKSLLNPFEFFGVKGFGFTKENELFVGRVAQLGFAASLIGETLTGRGPLAQFDFETGISLRDTEFGLLVFIGFFFFAAINPGSGKFVPEEEVEEEPVPAKKRK
ncbi:hypothetical protein DUNSADRAFT_12468 [Dunaliella salina]|uniref:Uncharacterized protein n=1 Tax=Dunaliella salina TaxID=3046 RepID=A0ABQ7H3X3_DUNSA|nr:hypothetical protein DUNSADRAFT_12468 [Dunaliella salina]|eukprot:KAF5841540.1 hypothetical protein DUNSADRAFT_12468 [Dunaliella salina]